MRKAKSNDLKYNALNRDMPYTAPVMHYQGDAGYDLTVSRTVTVPPGGVGQVPHNIRVALPTGVWGLIIGRSSTFHNKGLIVIPAVIDNGWRGELFAMIFNVTPKPVVIKQGDRIAQFILFNQVSPKPVFVTALPEGDRGERGFGSTGGHSEA